MKNVMANDLERLKAKDLMNPSVIFATGDMTVRELADLFETENITGVPVVNAKGKVMGVVSETDIVATDAMRESNEGRVPDYFRSTWQEGEPGSEAIDYEKMTLPTEKTVEDIMTPWFVAVGEDAPIAEVARKMFSEGIHRVLVMDTKDHLKGIISSMDIVRIVAGAAHKEHKP